MPAPLAGQGFGFCLKCEAGGRHRAGGRLEPWGNELRVGAHRVPWVLVVAAVGGAAPCGVGCAREPWARLRSGTTEPPGSSSRGKEGRKEARSSPGDRTDPPSSLLAPRAALPPEKGQRLHVTQILPARLRAFPGADPSPAALSSFPAAGGGRRTENFPHGSAPGHQLPLVPKPLAPNAPPLPPALPLAHPVVGPRVSIKGLAQKIGPQGWGSSQSTKYIHEVSAKFHQSFYFTRGNENHPVTGQQHS